MPSSAKIVLLLAKIVQEACVGNVLAIVKNVILFYAIRVVEKMCARDVII
jgi:hypothetical protein